MTCTEPLCPQCGDLVTDSPKEDLHEGGNFVECQVCGVPVCVVVRTTVAYDVTFMGDSHDLSA